MRVRYLVENLWVDGEDMTFINTVLFFPALFSVLNCSEENINAEDESDSKLHFNMFTALDFSREMKNVVNNLWGTPEMKVSSI